MNKRYLPCGKKEVFAIGAENSINDCKEKLAVCFDCHNFIDCQQSQSIFEAIKSQQNAHKFLAERIKACPICKKAVCYGEGVYLKKGAEVHIKCLQEKRKAEALKNV
jgi:hypothetical protein